MIYYFVDQPLSLVSRWGHIKLKHLRWCKETMYKQPARVHETTEEEKKKMKQVQDTR